MTSTWSREQTSKLISLYKENRHLYDVKNDFYTNRDVKNATINNMVEILNDCRPNTTPKDVLSKIKTLRTQYTMEKQKIKRSDGAYISSLWCFNQLHFLKQHTKIRGRSYYIESEEYSNSSSEDVNGDNRLNQEIQKNPNKKLRTELNESEQEDSHGISLANTLCNEIRKRKSTNHSFAKFIMDELDSIGDKNILDDLKWQVQVAVRQAKVKLKQQNVSASSANDVSLTKK